MPVALGESVYTPPAPQFPPRKTWTREECAAYECAGLWKGQHYELIEGELIDKMGKKRRHVQAARSVAHALEQIFRWDLIATEAPINVAPEDNPASEPEPDIYVAKTRDWPGDNPKPEHLILVVEISDSTLAFDLGVKAGLYARAGIVEYWALDLNGRRLIVHREPSGSVYKSVVAYSESESVAPLTGQGQVLVADLLR